MRKIVLLAAIVAAVAMGSQVVQAGDQGGGRHFAPHKGMQLHRPHHGFERNRGFFGKARHFGSFGRQRFVSRFGDQKARKSRFDPMPRFRPDYFRVQVLELHRSWRPWRTRGFGFGKQVRVWNRQVRVWDRQAGVWDRQLGVWDRQLRVWDRQMGVWDRQMGVWHRQVRAWRLRQPRR